MSEARNNANFMCAVSYTHLDVYKRQRYISVDIPSLSGYLDFRETSTS